jgi:hypothetical protein
LNGGEHVVVVVVVSIVGRGSFSGFHFPYSSQSVFHTGSFIHKFLQLLFKEERRESFWGPA